jgi:thiol-disulfide isomerase/thioredoxin
MDRIRCRCLTAFVCGLGWFAVAALPADDARPAEPTRPADEVAPANVIVFSPSIEAARADGGAEKPVVVTFSAPWCGWCRKMASSTFPDPQVAAIAEQYRWVKLDPDDAPALAARYKVNGLPHTIVLNPQDQLLGSQPGYMTPGGLVRFLEESLANPQPLDVLPEPLLLQLEHFDQADDPAHTIRETVERLSTEDRAQRAELAAALQSAGPAVYPHLAQLIADDRLALRAAAGGLLMELTRADLPFDPFADGTTRRTQAATWQSKFPALPPEDLPLNE